MPRLRPYILRFFVTWLKTSRSRFLISAPQIVGSDNNSLRITFPGLAGNIGGYVDRRKGITVFVNYNNQFWDAWGDFDIVEVKSAQGYFCKLCLPEYKELFSTRSELWTCHCFERFLTWCNDSLATAHWLALYDYDGITEARLLRDKSEDTWSESIIAFKQALRRIDDEPMFDDSQKYSKTLIPLRRKLQSSKESILDY